MKKLYAILALALLVLGVMPQAMAYYHKYEPKAREVPDNAMKAAKVDNLPAIKGNALKGAMIPIATKEKGFDKEILKKYLEKKNLALNTIKKIKENGIENVDPNEINNVVDFWITASERALEKLKDIRDKRVNSGKPVESIDKAIEVIEENLASLREILKDGVTKEEMKLVREYIKNVNDALRSAVREVRADRIIGIPREKIDNAAEKLNMVVNKLKARSVNNPNILNAVNAIEERLKRFDSSDVEKAKEELSFIREGLENVVSGKTPTLEETPVDVEETETQTQ